MPYEERATVAASEALFKKVINESSVLTLESGLGALFAILSNSEGARKVSWFFHIPELVHSMPFRTQQHVHR